MLYLSSIRKTRGRTWLSASLRQRNDRSPHRRIQAGIFHLDLFSVQSGEGLAPLFDKTTASAARYFNYKMDARWKGHPAAAEAVACLELQK